MGKRNGKTAPVQDPDKGPALDTSDSVRYAVRQEGLHDSARTRRDQYKAQVYTDYVEESSKKYKSSMDDLKEQLAAAQDGLSKMNEKSTTDSVLAALDYIAELRRKQISVVNTYISELAGLDSDRLKSIRETGNEKNIRVAEQINEKVTERNKGYQEDIYDLDKIYDEIAIDDNMSFIEVRRAKEEQQHVLDEKYAATLKYAKFLMDMAIERDNLINPSTISGDERNRLLAELDLDDAADTKEKSSRPKSRTARKFESAFVSATESARDKFDRFKNLPVIHGISIGASYVGSKLSPKFDGIKSDIRAGYAAMKLSRQERRVKREINKLDELNAKQGNPSFMNRMRGYFEEQFRPDEYDMPESVRQEEQKEIRTSETVETSEAQNQPAPQPVGITSSAPEDESSHDRYVRMATNKAAIDILSSKDGLGSLLNTYFWDDVSKTSHVVDDLAQSANVLTDLSGYTNRLKEVIGHLPEESQNPLLEKIEKDMISIYGKKTEIEKSVTDAEERMRQSQEFLESIIGAEPQAEAQDDAQKE